MSSGQIIRNRQRRWEDGIKVHDSSTYDVKAYGSSNTVKTLQQAKDFIKQQTKRDLQIRSRVFIQPTFANHISLCVYNCRINLTNCHGFLPQLSGFFIFLWIFMFFATILWTIFFLILTFTILIGIGQFIQFCCAHCVKSCKKRKFNQTCFYAGLVTLWEYFKIMACIGFQPRINNSNK